MKSKYLLIDLEENEKLTTILSNKTAKKIIAYLSENEEATQTQLAEELNIAHSTIHYNLEQLLEAGLLDWDRYHYSEKGKEVRHYKLAQQYIIITPKKNKGVLERLKDILPAFVVSILGIGVFGLTKLFSPSQGYESAEMMAADTAVRTTESAQITFDPWIWFLLGVFTVTILYILTIVLKKYRKR